ncbi:MAG: hypothetical protein C5S38_08290 [Candidatus Methanophagaceae archaeon]|nr:MAG: hypothetical protein C5S38_08290 [Methanophagales archaeon]
MRTMFGYKPLYLIFGLLKTEKEGDFLKQMGHTIMGVSPN